MISCTVNGLSAVLNLNNNQLQTLLSGKFGDGYLSTPRTICSNSHFSTNCTYEEYLKFKKHLLGDLSFNITSEINRGYKENTIYRLSTRASEDITKIRNMSIQEALNLVDELGIALWVYDDGSLHKNKLFYNINTQAFSEEVNRDLFVPFFQKFNIKAIPTIERKKNGKEYWYLRVSKYQGAYEISEILNKYPVDCYKYKIWDSETILKWSKLVEQLKSIPLDINEIHPRTLASLMNKNLSNEDIVQTLAKVKDRMLKRHSK